MIEPIDPFIFQRWDRSRRAVLQFTHPTDAQLISCGPGWNGLINSCIKDAYAIDSQFVVYEVKEKHGGLQISLGSRNHETALRAMVYYYCVVSEYICEVCGAPGRRAQVPMGRGTKGWFTVKALCQEHFDERVQ